MSKINDSDDDGDDGVLIPHDYKDDELIINYKDACIYGRDWKLLMEPHGGGWLNDSCIHYQLQRLQDECLLPSSALSNSVLLLEPAVTSFFVHQCIDNDELEEFAMAHQLHVKDRLLIPIHDLMRNDDDAVSSSWRIPGRGMHWSLLALLIVGKDNRILGYHYDSIPESGNRLAAECVARKLGTLIQRQGRKQRHDNENCIIEVQECKVPKQTNGYDCGIHVLMTVESMLETWKEDAERDGSNDNNKESATSTMIQTIGRKLQILLNANPNYCSELRKRMAQDILKKAAQQS